MNTSGRAQFTGAGVISIPSTSLVQLVPATPPADWSAAGTVISLDAVNLTVALSAGVARADVQLYDWTDDEVLMTAHGFVVAAGGPNGWLNSSFRLAEPFQVATGQDLTLRLLILADAAVYPVTLSAALNVEYTFRRL